MRVSLIQSSGQHMRYTKQLSEDLHQSMYSCYRSSTTFSTEHNFRTMSFWEAFKLEWQR